MHPHHSPGHCRSVLPLLLMAALLAGCATQPSLDTNKELPVGCLAKPDPGPCRAAQTRFFYDYRDNRCKPFRYGGCEGRVPFETLAECRSFCEP
ncbi:proteinase inhibitor I4 serpin [Marichromatium purpuratum 984]|uniref:Proteinase inhibitor I4 serpin n=1 Tax=Marichromatium purpuratum 984 TaxID=765910 RepID=W0DZC7_MARPU|nr:BPTI/Kunitz domain-containing protein [Marichromatium purpuratum]AHF03802.1 proteinase inhibitor I4 serpin [Marichromatium purpuratum 984]